MAEGMDGLELAEIIKAESSGDLDTSRRQA
jgi:hypothetical protein